MPLKSKDIAGFQGKEIEIYVFKGNDGNGNPEDSHKLRGAQNCNTTEEQSETRVSEMGFEATKVLYGSSTYSASITMLVRDLYQIAKVAGVSVLGKRLALQDFQKVNLVARYRDPDTGNYVHAVVMNGFKSKSSPTSMAVDANATITLEGGCDVIAKVERNGLGKVKTIEYNFTATDNDTGFLVDLGVQPTDLTEALERILLVECPSGTLLSDSDITVDWAEATPTSKVKIKINSSVASEIPDNQPLRISYEISPSS